MSEMVLVTGATGFVGGWCIAALLERGYRVRTTVRSAAKEAAMRGILAPIVGPKGAALEFVVADLTRDAGWGEAVAGCDYVLHVASPLGAEMPKNPDDLIVPAREGTLRVLRAAVKAGVKRVVMTSSVAASSPAQRSPDSATDESFWTDPNEPGLTAYRLSKTLAERAAWDFMAKEGGRTELVTVLPTAVLGPVMSAESLGSAQVVSRLMTGSMPGTPPLGFNVVDVRDVADLHLRAMLAPEAAGQRFIAASSYLSMADIARILRARLGVKAAKVPTRAMPGFMLRLAALFDPALRAVTPGMGRRRIFLSDKARKELGWQPRTAEEAVVACAESLIAAGAV